MPTCRTSRVAPFRASKAQRQQVRMLTAFRSPQEEIRRVVVNPKTGRPISLKMLRKHFRRELETGGPRARAEVVQSLYQQSLGTPAIHDKEGRLVQPARAPVATAAVFFLTGKRKEAGETEDKDERPSKKSWALDKFDRNV